MPFCSFSVLNEAGLDVKDLVVDTHCRDLRARAYSAETDPEFIDMAWCGVFRFLGFRGFGQWWCEGIDGIDALDLKARGLLG